MSPPRRALIRTAAAALVLLPIPVRAADLSPEVEAALAAILQGLAIEAPDAAENGGQVPVTLRVDSP